MNIYDQAHGLARAMKESQEYQDYLVIKAEVSKNQELSDMINDFQGKQMEMQTQQMLGGQMDSSVMESVQALYQILAKDPLAAQYMAAAMNFSRMVADVYAILGEAVKID